MLRHVQARKEREINLRILVQGENTICMDKVISPRICGEGFTPGKEIDN